MDSLNIIHYPLTNGTLTLSRYFPAVWDLCEISLFSSDGSFVKFLLIINNVFNSI